MPMKNTFIPLLWCPKNKGMKVFFMGIVIHVMDMVTKLLNVDLMKEDIIEESITPQDVGDVIK